MKSRYLKKSKPPGLMLTSLLDMFTIILIFLIVSFKNEDYNFHLNRHLKLPESTARSVFKPAVSVAITPGGLYVERKKILGLTNGKFAQKYYDLDQIPLLITKLKGYYKPDDDNTAPAKPGQKVKKSHSIILIQADKRLDYRTLYLVMRSASIAGFVKYRLAIFKK